VLRYREVQCGAITCLKRGFCNWCPTLSPKQPLGNRTRKIGVCIVGLNRTCNATPPLWESRVPALEDMPRAGARLLAACQPSVGSWVTGDLQLHSPLLRATSGLSPQKEELKPSRSPEFRHFELRVYAVSRKTLVQTVQITCVPSLHKFWIGRPPET
jgi:hypothetical protein